MAGGSIEVQVYDFKYYDNYSSTAFAISEITDKVPLLLLLLLLLMSRERERMAYLLIIDYLRHTLSPTSTWYILCILCILICRLGARPRSAV